MTRIRTFRFSLAALAALSLAVPMTPASAQIVPPPIPSVVAPPPPPPAPPPPPIEVPKVPKLNETPAQPKAAPGKRSSFGDRVVACLDDGVSGSLSSGERAAYARACAQR